MTELDTVKRAKMYMEKLAMGIDPLTDKPIPVGEVATAPRMRKCFQYVAGLLEQIADNGGIVGEDRKGNIHRSGRQRCWQNMCSRMCR